MSKQEQNAMRDEDLLFSVLVKEIRGRYIALRNGNVMPSTIRTMYGGLTTITKQVEDDEQDAAARLINGGFLQPWGEDSRFVQLTPNGFYAAARNPRYTAEYVPALDAVVYGYFLLNQLQKYMNFPELHKQGKALIFDLYARRFPTIFLDHVNAHLRWIDGKAAYSAYNIVFEEVNMTSAFDEAKKEVETLSAFFAKVNEEIVSSMERMKQQNAYPYTHYTVYKSYE